MDRIRDLDALTGGEDLTTHVTVRCGSDGYNILIEGASGTQLEFRRRDTDGGARWELGLRPFNADEITYVQITDSAGGSAEDVFIELGAQLSRLARR